MTDMNNLRYVVGTLRAGTRITGLALATPGSVDKTPDIVMLHDVNSYLLRNKATLVNAKVDSLNQVYFGSKTDADTYVVMTNTAKPVSFLGRSSRRLHAGNIKKDANGNYVGVTHSYIVTDILDNSAKVQVMNDKGRLADMSQAAFIKYVAEGLIVSNVKIENGKSVLLSRPLHEFTKPDTSIITDTKPAVQPIQNQPTAVKQPTQPAQPVQTVQTTTIPDLTPPKVDTIATAGDVTNRKITTTVTSVKSTPPVINSQPVTPVAQPVQQIQPTKKRNNTAWLNLDSTDTVEQATITRWLQQDDPDINLRLNLELDKVFPSNIGEEFFDLIEAGNSIVLKYSKHANNDYDFTDVMLDANIVEYNAKWKSVLDQISRENNISGKLNTLKVQLTWKKKVITAIDYRILYREEALANVARVLEYSHFDLLICKKTFRLAPKQRPRNVWFIVLPNKEVNADWTEISPLHSILGQIDYIDLVCTREYDALSNQIKKIPSLVITTHPTFHPNEIQGKAFGLSLGALYGIGHMKDITATLDLSSTFIRFLPQDALSFNFCHNLIIKLPDTCTRIHTHAISCKEGYSHVLTEIDSNTNVHDFSGNVTYNTPPERAYKLSDVKNAARQVKVIGNSLTRLDEVGYSIIYTKHGSGYSHDFYLDISECNENITTMMSPSILLDSLPTKMEKFVNTLKPVSGGRAELMPADGTEILPNYMLGHWSNIGKGKIKAVFSLSSEELKQAVSHHCNMTVSGDIKSANLCIVNNSDLDTFGMIDNLTFEEGIEDITIFYICNITSRRVITGRHTRTITVPSGPHSRIKNVILPSTCKAFKTLQPSSAQPIDFIETVYYAQNSIMEAYLKDSTGYAEIAIPYAHAASEEDDMLTNLLGGSIDDAVLINIDYNFAKTNLTSAGVIF